MQTSGLPQHIAASEPRGNLTSVRQFSDANDAVSTVYSYDDAGTLRQTSGSNGITNYTSFDSTDTFATGATLPPTPSGITLTQSAVQDSSSGVTKSTTDPNGLQTTYGDFDALSRPQLITYPDGGHEYLTYSPGQLIDAHNIDSSGARVERYTLYDGYGRLSRIADENGQSSNNWYQMDYCYDANGRVTFQPVRYQGGGWATAKQCSGAGDTTTYDALGRVTKVTHADGSLVQYAYHGRATQVTDEYGISRILQVDGLGRLTAVCEISSGSIGTDSSSACVNAAGGALDRSGTGFSTQYAYGANDTVTITQGLQTRMIQTDWLGRLIQLQEPETGGSAAPTTVSYTYNSTGLQMVRKRTRANVAGYSTFTTTTDCVHETLPTRPSPISYANLSFTSR